MKKIRNEEMAFGPPSYGDPRSAIVNTVHWPHAPLSKTHRGKRTAGARRGAKGKYMKKPQGWTY